MKNPMTINELVDTSFRIADEHGWHESERPIPEMLMLLTTELAEAMEDYRTQNMELYFDDNGKPCGFVSEIADVFIRLGDLCGMLGIDIEKAIEIKHMYNRKRSYRHGGKVA